MINWRNVDPGKLDPQFRADVEKLLVESQYTWIVLYGYRTLKEQMDLWDKYQAGGPKAAPPGKSAHNYGLAVDVVPAVGEHGLGFKPDWNINDPAWVWLFDAVFKHPRLHSGRSFDDSDHIEAVNWKSLAATAPSMATPSTSTAQR